MIETDIVPQYIQEPLFREYTIEESEIIYCLFILIYTIYALPLHIPLLIRSDGTC